MVDACATGTCGASTGASEVHYAVNQQARLVGRLEWRVEGDGEDLEQGEEIMRQAFGADLRSIAVMAAIHLQVVGRFWLVRGRTRAEGRAATSGGS